MEVTQIYTLINNVSGEVLGKTGIVTEDLKGIVDLGKEVFNQNAVDNYVKSLVNHIGKVIFVNRPYAGKVPSVLMDAWEFGSVLEKISADVPEAEENDTWNLKDGQTYSQDVFHKPTVTAKFFNSKVTFEVPVSITERQVKESFSNAAQLNGFISMIYAAVEKSMTIKADALIMRTINNMIAETVLADAQAFGAAAAGDMTGVDLSSASTARCVNLLKLYNDKTGATTKLTAAKAITDPDFIRFASYVMGTYADRLQSISTLFNVGGKERFTPKDMLHVVLLSEFAKAAQTYLYSDTFNRGDVLLPQAETVPFWQGSGQNYEFASAGNINIKESGGKAVEISGVLGVMFDRDALGVCNLDRRVTTNYNAKAEFFNNYYKFDAGYFNDTNENFVVFFIE
ncbi:hypothetical protein [Barnesiella intestinihominis]|uniref:hypothetical protein n=1 Tax=Barnesiella intestinihominis TaxID=487174 RepID=UPI003AAF536E